MGARRVRLSLHGPFSVWQVRTGRSCGPRRVRLGVVATLTTLAGVLTTVSTPAHAGAPGQGVASAALPKISVTINMLSAATVAAIRSDADWILTSQAPDGAIATAPDQVHVRPYLGNFAALGLVAAGRATGDTRYIAAAWRWLRWYQGHQEADGFVWDYDKAADGRLVSTGDIDATDACAGTFLVAVRAAYVATGDRTQLTALRQGVAGAVQAIQATLQPDGLTWAKPTWQVKYLMDQAESYAGLRAAADITSTTGGPAAALEVTGNAASVSAGVDRLWNANTESFDWAKHSTGAQTATAWANLYPDALQQPWAVAFNVVTAGTATRLLARFEAAHPNWDRPNSTALIDGTEQRVGYWAPVGWAYLRTGNRERAATAARRIRNAARAAGRAWPFTPADAGQLIVLQAGSLDLLTP